MEHTDVRASSLRTHCSLCGEAMSDVLVVAHFADFSILRCAHCGLVERSIILESKKSEELYGDTYFFDEHRDYFLTHEDDKKKRFARQLALIETHATSPLKKVLDVGCGIGTFVRVAAEYGWEAEGQDISASSVAYTKARGGKAYLGTLSSCGLPASSYGLVTIFDALNHTEEPRETLSEVGRVLVKDGLCFVEMNADDSLLSIFARLLARLSGGRFSMGLRLVYPVHQSSFFTPRTLEALFIKTGFTVVYRARTRFNTASCSIRRRKGLVHAMLFTILNTLGNILGRPMNITMIGKKL